MRTRPNALPILWSPLQLLTLCPACFSSTALGGPCGGSTIHFRWGAVSAEPAANSQEPIPSQLQSHKLPLSCDAYSYSLLARESSQRTVTELLAHVPASNVRRGPISGVHQPHYLLSVQPFHLPRLIRIAASPAVPESSTARATWCLLRQLHTTYNGETPRGPFKPSFFVSLALTT